MEQVSTMGSGQLGCELDLEKVVEALADVNPVVDEANFQNESMVTIRLAEGGPAITLYRTGSFQVRGGRTGGELVEAKDRLLADLDEIGVPISDPSFEQKTAVFMEDIGIHVDLDRAAIALGLENVEYEPEQFPGMVYQPAGYEGTLLVFASGKVIISGTNTEDRAQRGVQQLTGELEQMMPEMMED